jgi:hypothetical protein
MKISHRGESLYPFFLSSQLEFCLKALFEINRKPMSLLVCVCVFSPVSEYFYLFLFQSYNRLCDPCLKLNAKNISKTGFPAMRTV